MKLFPFRVKATSCDGRQLGSQTTWSQLSQCNYTETIITPQPCVSIAVMEEEFVDIDVRS